MEKGFKTREQCWAGTGPGLHPMGHGGLPCAASRQAGWASAWMPGPAEEAARGVGTGRARWSSPWRGHRAWYGMVACSPMARWRLDDGMVQPGSTRGLHGGRRREEGMVGSQRKRVNVRGRSGGGATVHNGGGGPPTAPVTPRWPLTREGGGE
jgi:hypothetical protein